MKKRLIGMAMAAILAMTALTGCGTAEDTSSLDSLTFTYVTSPLNLPSIVEKEKGIFTKAFADDGIEVKYAEITSGADQTQALAAGDVQVLYAVGATSVILSAANDADIKVLNIGEITVLADYFIIAGGTNRNQVQAMADNVEECLGRAGFQPKQIEGYQEANWILLDYGDVVVHLFDKENRRFYDLERIWMDGKLTSAEDLKAE